MADQEKLGISIKYETGMIFRNVRPVDDIVEEFESKHIPYVALDPATIKYGSWDVLLTFDKQENHDLFREGKLKLKAESFLAKAKGEEKAVNPLKASKRAAGRK